MPGDIPEVWFDSIAKEATAFRGSWQILLNRSDPVDELMKALGFSMIKRRVMATYSSITDMELIKNDEKSPVIKITTHLPLNNLKQSVVSFDNTWAEQKVNGGRRWLPMSGLAGSVSPAVRPGGVAHLHLQGFFFLSRRTPIQAPGARGVCGWTEERSRGEKALWEPCLT